MTHPSVHWCLKWIIGAGRRAVSALGVPAASKDCLATLALFLTICSIINRYLFILLLFRPGEAGAVLQTQLSLTDWSSQSVSHPLWKYLQNTVSSKPWELGSWNFERMFTPQHVSQVTCPMSHITCHMSHVMCICFYIYFFFLQIGEASWLRVCYQRSTAP